MLQTYADFAAVPTSDHPGQPVRSEPGFDVWFEPAGRGNAARFFLIPADGQRLYFPTLAAACHAAHDLIRESAPAAPTAAAPAIPIPGPAAP